MFLFNFMKGRAWKWKEEGEGRGGGRGYGGDGFTDVWVNLQAVD